MSTPITATMVKELRERSGAGMMECKKALEVTQGDIDKAIEELRKSGRSKADKKAGRVAAEGLVLVAGGEQGKPAVMLEINSETDFVARDENFLEFAKAVTQAALAAGVVDVAALGKLPLHGKAGVSIEEARQALVAKVGENITIRRAVLTKATSGIASYVHGGRIGVLVEMEGGDTALGKDIAMHVAASRPLVISPDEVSKDLVAKEREIYFAQANDSGKPQNIVEKMVEGRLKKFLGEVSLVGQPFVKDPEVMVGDLLNKHKAKVLAFTRFEVGEGIEKVTENFAEAVMSQAGG